MLRQQSHLFPFGQPFLHRHQPHASHHRPILLGQHEHLPAFGKHFFRPGEFRRRNVFLVFHLDAGIADEVDFLGSGPIGEEWDTVPASDFRRDHAFDQAAHQGRVAQASARKLKGRIPAFTGFMEQVEQEGIGGIELSVLAGRPGAACRLAPMTGQYGIDKVEEGQVFFAGAVREPKPQVLIDGPGEAPGQKVFLERDALSGHGQPFVEGIRFQLSSPLFGIERLFSCGGYWTVITGMRLIPVSGKSMAMNYGP